VGERDPPSAARVGSLALGDLLGFGESCIECMLAVLKETFAIAAAA
jgi:hypothetical protein